MTEILLTLICLGLLGYVAWINHKSYGERREWMKALLAKDLTEFTHSEVSEKQEPTEETPPEFVPLDEVDESGFQKMINRQLNKEKDE